jgi:hypothetical protein
MDDSTRSATPTYHQKYASDHRVELNAKARERHHGRIPKVRGRALKAARANPRYEQEHAVRGYVICRVSDCGAKVGTLAEHLRRLHDQTSAKYREAFPEAPLFSRASREKLSTAGRLPREIKSLRHHPGESPTRPWTIAALRVAGKTAAEIAKIIGRQSDSVRHVCLRLQLPKCGYDLGSQVTIGRVAKLFRATGLDRKSFAHHFGIPERLASEIYPRFANRRLTPVHAGPIIEARDRLIRQIFERNRNGGERRWLVPSIAGTLRALVPDLPQVSATLRALLAQSRAYLRKNSGAQREQWQDWLCEKERLHLLPLAVELWPFIEDKIQALRTRRDLRKLGTEILASRFGVSLSVVHHSGATRPPQAERIERFILRTQHSRPGAPAAAVEEPRSASQNKGGRPAVMSEKTLWRISVIAALKKLNRWSEENFKLVYPDTPASASANARAHASRHKKRVLNLEQRLTVADAEAILQEPKPA